MARQAAVGLSVAVLVLCMLLLPLKRDDKSTLREAPVSLTTAALSQTGLHWLGGGTYGDPFSPMEEKHSSRAHLAPAARSVEAGWKKTLGDMYHSDLNLNSLSVGTLKSGRSEQGDERYEISPFVPPQENEPHGKLLSTAQVGQELWKEQIKAMQAGELQANREIMNTVALVKKESDLAKPKWEKKVMLSTAADRKTEAHARLTALAAKATSVEVAAVQGSHASATKFWDNAVQALRPPVDHGKEKLAIKEPASTKKPADGAKNKLAIKEQARSKKLARQVAVVQALKSVNSQERPPSLSRVATSDSSRHAMSSFFDSLAARDEAKHVLHEARYPRTRSVRSMLPTSIMPAKPAKAEMTHLEKEVSWLRKRVEVLQDALLQENEKKVHQVGSSNKKVMALQSAPTEDKTQRVKGNEEKHVEDKHAYNAVGKPSSEYLALVRPPPRGCPLFAAPHENLPVDCPRLSLAQMKLHRYSTNEVFYFWNPR
jgi:hypothetical protein